MILFSDFDDTLYTWNNLDQFSNNLTAIQKFRAAGNQFCLATGRSLRSVAKKFSGYVKYCDYLVLDNGGVCVDADGNIIFTHSIALDVTNKLTDTVSEIVDDVMPVYYYDFGMHQTLEKPPTKIRYWVKDNDLATKLTADIEKIYNFRTYTYQNIQLEADWLPEERLDGYIAYSEVMSDKAGKETAVTELSAKLNFPTSEIITVGDDWNDLKMIQKFDGYVIANSKPEILAHVAPTHTVHSVAELIEDLLK